MYDFDFFSKKKAKIAVSKSISENLFEEKFNIFKISRNVNLKILFYLFFDQLKK